MTSNLPRIKDHLNEVARESFGFVEDCDKYLQVAKKELQHYRKQITDKILELKEVWSEIKKEEMELEENGLSITKNMPLIEIRSDTWLLERRLGEAVVVIEGIENTLKAFTDGCI